MLAPVQKPYSLSGRRWSRRGAKRRERPSKQDRDETLALYAYGKVDGRIKERHRLQTTKVYFMHDAYNKKYDHRRQRSYDYNGGKIA